MDAIVSLARNKLNGKSENKQSSNTTDLFFYKQTPESLAQAIERFDAKKELFNWQVIRGNAESFDRAIFKDKIRSYIVQKYSEFELAHSGC